MAPTKERISDRASVRDRTSDPTEGDRARQELLAGMPVTERRLRLNGVSTAVLEGGSGRPIVLLHGPGEHAARWFRVIPSLATTHRVIAPDLPGHGEAEPGGASLGADGVLTWLDDLIERTCETPPVLVGQVLGGAIAARFASGRPKRLGGLVLVDTLGLVPFEPAREFGEALFAFLSGPTEDTHDGLWRRCAFDLDAMRQRAGKHWNAYKAYTLELARSPQLQATQGILMEQFGMRPIPAAELERISVPTTLIWGRHDLATPLAAAQDTSARYAWPLLVIERAGGDPSMEQPVAFVEALRTALPPGARMTGTSNAGHDTRAAWDKIAAGYDRTNTATQLALGSEAVRRAALRPGMRFLDVAAGSGALAIPAARAGANVVAIDQSSLMLDLLRKRAQHEALDIQARVMDGHALDLDDNSFDVVGSQFGVMLFPDLAKGIREMVRVTKPGGLVLVVAYGDPHRIDFLGFFVGAIQSVRPGFDGPPTDPAPLEFQLSDPHRLREVLSDAGLRGVSVETIMERTEFGAGEALWDWIVSSNPIAEQILESLALSVEERQTIRRSLERMVREHAGAAGVATLTNPINIGIGTKSG